MRYAVHRVGESEIYQMMEAPEHVVEGISAPDMVFIPVDDPLIDGATHHIVDGKVVRKEQPREPVQERLDF